jgi:CheY-like chemotaxis protein
MAQQQKVLIMEDDRLYNLFLRQFLEGCGFSVVEAWSLSECQTLMREEQPDAIVCDVGVAAGPEPTARYLPMGGLNVLDWLSRQKSVPRPGITIVMSDTMTPGMRAQFQERGVTAILDKPLRPDALVRLLRGRRVDQSSSAQDCRIPPS